MLKPHDILMTKDGTIGKLAYIKELPEKATVASHIFVIRNNSNKLDQKFLFFYFKSKPFQWIVNSRIEGSVIPALYQRDIVELKVPLPSVSEQKAIASILSSLDSKIDLLRRQNQTLENIAQALFKRWFVDFEFPDKDGKPYKSSGGKMVESELGEIPEGWKVGIVNNLCQKLASGGTPSTKNNEYYSGEINWFSTKELNDNYLFESERKITEEGLSNSSAKLFPRDAVVMAIYAAPTVGRLGILAKESTFNQAACGFIANENICCNEFIYLFLLYSRNILNNLANGAAQQNLNVGIVLNFPVILADKFIMKKFKELIRPIFNKIYVNSYQTQTLTKTRDTMLPKLMSGQIRVKDL